MEEVGSAAMSSRRNSASWNRGTDMSLIRSLRYAISELLRCSILFDRFIQLLVLNTTLLLRFRYFHEDEPINLCIYRLLHFNIRYMLYEVVLSCHDLYVDADLVEDDQGNSSLVEKDLGDLLGKHLIVIISMSFASSASVLMAAYAILYAHIVTDMLNIYSDYLRLISNDSHLYIGKIREASTNFVRNGSVANTIANINTYIDSFKSCIREVEETSPLGAFSYMLLLLHVLSVFLFLAFENWRLLLSSLKIEFGCSVLVFLVVEILKVEAILAGSSRGVRRREAVGRHSNIARMLEDIANARERASSDTGKQYVDYAADDGELEVTERSNSSVLQPVATVEIVQSVSPSTSGGQLVDMEINSVQSVVESSSNEESEEIKSTDDSSVRSVVASVYNEESGRTHLFWADRDWIVVEEDI